MLNVALGGGPTADGAGAGGVPDLGQVPELDSGIMALGFEPVVTRVCGQRVGGDDQVGPGPWGLEPPGTVPAGRAVPAGRGEGEPACSWRSGTGVFPVFLGFGTGAAVGDGVPPAVGDRQAPGGPRAGRGGRGQVAGQPRVDRAQLNQTQLNQTRLNPMLSASGGAARFVLVENTDPLDATAISRVQQLQHDLPALARAAGLRGARFELAGQTALTGDSIGSVFADLGRVALAIVAVTLVLLVLFLRSLLAPVYLLAASVLAVFATLGLTIGIGQHILGYGSLVYFVPFAAGVLLVSLGSDYNVFVVGRIWEEARRRPVADAVAVAAPQASRAITTAGVALAASFAMLAVIPLEQFRQIALAMALGVVLDAIAVRSLLVPALVALFGRLGMWPGNRRARPEPAPAAPPPVPAGDQP